MTAQANLADAESYRAEIDAETLSAQLAKQVNRFDKGLPLLKMALDFAPAVPSLLGVDEPRTYLIIAQNNDELRATGGFISGVGTVTFTQYGDSVTYTVNFGPDGTGVLDDGTGNVIDV